MNSTLVLRGLPVRRLVVDCCGVILENMFEMHGFELRCDAISPAGRVPELHLGPGHGANAAPTMRWHGEPEGTQAFALTLTDRDAPGYDHWLVVADGDVHEIGASAVDGRTLIGQGTRLFGYEGPCPPEGTHHYVFTVHALSQHPQLQAGFTGEQLRAAIADTTLATATLEATYNAGLVRSLAQARGRVIGRLRRLAA